ncbi:MAG: HD domain-containing protein [Candidatus Cryptobacteroides sp.]
MKHYIERNILPEYDNFDGAHQRDHVIHVIEQSLELAKHYDVDINMVYAIAAYHDIGLAVDRKTHHLESGKIVRSDGNLRRWFTPEQIEVMAQAVEDHRASNDHEPRSIYGKIVAEADRQIDSMTIIRRTIQFGLSHNPELDREGQWERTLEHLNEKYGEGGYLTLWIPESPNAARLEEFRRQLRDTVALRRIFDGIYDSLMKQE